MVVVASTILEQHLTLGWIQIKSKDGAECGCLWQTTPKIFIVCRALLHSYANCLGANEINHTHILASLWLFLLFESLLLISAQLYCPSVACFLGKAFFITKECTTSTRQFRQKWQIYCFCVFTVDEISLPYTPKLEQISSDHLLLLSLNVSRSVRCWSFPCQFSWKFASQMFC